MLKIHFVTFNTYAFIRTILYIYKIIEITLTDKKPSTLLCIQNKKIRFFVFFFSFSKTNYNIVQHFRWRENCGTREQNSHKKGVRKATERSEKNWRVFKQKFEWTFNIGFKRIENKRLNAFMCTFPVNPLHNVKYNS